MVKLFIVRHGKTDWNERGLVQGWTDIPLNETGIRDAEELSKSFDFSVIDICLCSPLTRAKQTAQILVEKEKIKYFEALKERKLGYLEGGKTTFDDIKLLWDYKMNYNENGVESLRDCLARADEVLQNIKEHYDNKSVLLVTHGAFMKALKFNLEGYDENIDFLTDSPRNTTLYEYELE